ncbi:MAG: hypothetical protein FWG92_04495 [Leptospirales bacterium]|nr:hypothetical protein [Leptospirales bacterium]
MRHLTVFFMCILALAVGFAVEDDLSMEGFLPANTTVFVKTEPIANLIVSAKNIISLVDGKSSSEITEQINTFKNKTGIDPLDENALRKTGLDTKRRIAFASLPSEEPCVLLPVSNGETFGRAFVEIMLKMNDEPDKRDLYPAITSYKNHKISQLGKDIFVAEVNKFFVVAYSGEQIRSVIDMPLQAKNTSLSQDPVYLSYLKQKNSNLKTIHAFIRGSYASGSSFKDDFVSSIDYILLGASIEKNKLLFQLGASLDKKDSAVKALLDFFSTGLTNLALHDSDSQVYSFIALNLNSLETLPDGPANRPKLLYQMLSTHVKETYGIDFKEDFSMYSKGVFNIMVGDIIKNENVVFMPMTDASKSLALNRKIQEHLKKKYEPRNLFGYENVGSFGKAAYYFGDTGIKNYVYSDQRGFYVATSISLLNEAAKKPYITADGKKPFAIKVNDNMWGFSVIKKNTLWPLLTKQINAGSNVDMNNFMKRLGNIYMSGSRNDSFISLDTEILIEK